MTRLCLFGTALLLLGCSEQTVELFDGSSAGADGSVTDLRLRDPENCGLAETHCEDDEYCVAGACVCRPGLTQIGDDCVDIQSDNENCGGAGATCALCVDGACGTACGAGQTECESGCFDTSSHPLHCGECDRPCGANQICSAGQCEEFTPAPCTSCPCDCARACCLYPGHPLDAICLEDADSC